MKIHAVGGFNEVGKNMTALEIEDDVLLFDAGLYLPAVVELEEKDRVRQPTEQFMRKINAIPDDIFLDRKNLTNKVRALLISHAHLDHIGAIPYLAHRYKADIVGTPFTMEFLKETLKNEKMHLPNTIKSITPNSKYLSNGNKRHEVEFINVTHSTPQSTIIAVKTDKGYVVYANDFKLDNNPVLGSKPNYEAFKRLAKEGVKALVIESLYAAKTGKTPSEMIARGLLEDAMLSTDNSGSLVIVASFSSHIARLKSIVDFGKRMNRRIVFLGRSLHKYVTAACKAKIYPFIKDIQMVTYRKQVASILNKINKNRQDYLVVCTGQQGEPGSVLDRISRRDTPLQLTRKDNILFSSKAIPTEITIANRSMVQKKLAKQGARIFDELHVSGHASREDLRDFIEMLQPEHIIPAHGGLKMQSSLIDLATEMGYKYGKNCHILQNGEHLLL